MYMYITPNTRAYMVLGKLWTSKKVFNNLIDSTINAVWLLNYV